MQEVPSSILGVAHFFEQRQGDPSLKMLLSRTYRFILLLALFKTVFTSCPFDLSCLDDSNDSKFPVITHGSNSSSRPIGTKRPFESIIEESTVESVKQSKENIALNSDNIISGPKPTIETLNKSASSKKRFSKIEVEMTPENIIENELKFGRKLNSEARVDVLRQTLNFIAENDLNSLINHQFTFKTVFGTKYSHYTRNGIDNYLLIFVILFGSHELYYPIKSSAKCNEEIVHILPDALRYLFNNKSFEVAMSTVLKCCSSIISKELQVELIKIINRRFPNLDYFERFLLNFIGSANTTDMERLFQMKTDLEKAGYLSQFFNQTEIEPLDPFQKFPLERPDIYCNPNMADSVKFQYLQAIFRNDNVDLLDQVLALYPEITNYNLNLGNFRYDSDNIFKSTTKYQAYKCFAYFLDLMREILDFEGIDYHMCPIRLAISSSKESAKFVEILETHQIIYERKVKDPEFKDPINLLIYSLHQGQSAAFKYYYDKAGVENAKSEIYQIWKSDNEIVKQLISKIKDSITKQVVSDFGINLNENKFTFNGSTGNASVFLDNYDRALYLNITLPTIRI